MMDEFTRSDVQLVSLLLHMGLDVRDASRIDANSTALNCRVLKSTLNINKLNYISVFSLKFTTFQWKRRLFFIF